MAYSCASGERSLGWRVFQTLKGELLPAVRSRRILLRRTLSGAVPPQIRYARSGSVSIAYQVAGEGTADLLMIPGYYDIALRDFGLALGALALARLSQNFDR